MCVANWCVFIYVTYTCVTLRRVPTSRYAHTYAGRRKIAADGGASREVVGSSNSWRGESILPVIDHPFGTLFGAGVRKSFRGINVRGSESFNGHLYRNPYY